MNQRRNGLSNVNGKSESVKEKERMIWSEVGMLVGTLSLLDIIVRGLVLNCPFREWAGSLAVFFIIIVYYCIRAAASGILLPAIHSEAALKKQIRRQMGETLAVAVIITLITMYDQGIPHHFTGWLKLIALFLVCSIFIFLVRYVAVRLIYRRSRKKS
ncbi:DUF6773 family protein [Bacillus amyloliquefaciens]|uniref:DUF6773 family protein n=1 Tax=Bacillus amyloliquefaciens TaxID=1390 RepID=UPI0005EDDEB5|nr:DUF6773 family protein [Bacillus amyloliquefaciens]